MTSPERDEAAFSAYVRTRQAHWVWLAEVLGPGGRAEAEDLVQTAFVRLAAHWPSVREPDPWMRRVLGNLVTDAVRHRARRPIAEPAPETLPGADRFEDTQADTDLVWRALAKLPKGQRKAVILRYLQDLSEEDTARELGISVGAVKSAGSRGLGRLRSLLREEEA